MVLRLRYWLYKMYVILSHNRRIGTPVKARDTTNLFNKYFNFCIKNRNIEYRAVLDNLNMSGEHKYVGGILYDDNIVLTPNKAETVLIKSNYNFKLIGELPPGDYKWTGEAIYNNKLFFFPRKSSNLLVFDGKKLNEIQGEEYKREHHYGGVLFNNYIIQPPRSSSHFLLWNLKKDISTRIKLCPKFISQYFRYSCSILHPNGFIYFFPENGRVIKMNPSTFKFKFVGNWIDRMIFDAKILPDGNIYGFTINKGGIVKFNVENEKVDILFEDLSIESYGTKLGLNGKIYSIPGSGSIVWEYDYMSNSVKKLFDLKDDGYAKYAGGCTGKTGIIYGAPAFANNMIKLIPSQEVAIPDSLYKDFWVDNY